MNVDSKTLHQLRAQRRSCFKTISLKRPLSLAAIAVISLFSVNGVVAQADQSVITTRTADPIPGPRDCFWSRGPASADPYINIAYPDANTFYWAATFSVPQGASLSLEGQFPHSRYMSFISYDEKGRPIESVADYLIKAKAGSSNPFEQGADRTAAQRDYVLGVSSDKPDPNRTVGVYLPGEKRSQIHATPYMAGQQTILYRIYARDKGVDETGGAGLPTPVLKMADGSVLRGSATCKALKTRQPLSIGASALAVPMEKYRELVNQPNKPAGFPATVSPTWFIQYDREYLYSIYTGEPLKNAKKSEGGFYPNVDNQYIRTIINRKLGKVLVVRAKAPTTPRTFNGDSKAGSGDLRYWSMCSNQGFANTRVNDCAYDEQIPVDAMGYYTVVLSREADRPRNATKACGITWLPMADNGDGAVDDDVTVLQLRHMLGNKNFSHAVQNISKPGDEEKVMGEYFPKGQYTTTSSFEIAIPCLLSK